MSKSDPLLLLGRVIAKKNAICKGLLRALGICLLACVALDFFGERHIKNTHEYIIELTVPIKVMSYKMTQFSQHIRKYFDMQHENEMLNHKLEKLKLDKVILSDTLKELNELKKVLDVKYKSEKFNMIEKVLGYSKSIFSSNIIVSKTHETTQENSIAVAPDGVVGVIVSTDNDVAEILPITSSKIAIPVKTQSGIHLIMSGTDRDEMISREIQGDNLSSLTTGDILYTSGEGGIYPMEVPVAKIIFVDKKHTKIIAKPAVETENISFVYIARPITSD